MKIFVNGDLLEVAADASMAMLLRQLDLEGQRLAVEVNEELVARSRFQEHLLRQGDKVEIVRAIGGG